MYQNGDFSWKMFFLGFLTRKFLIAVGIQIVATFLAYYAFDIVLKTATEKGSVDSKTIISIFETWCYFTIGNASAFGLFNSTSKFASNSLQKIKSGISALTGSEEKAKEEKQTSNVQPPPDQRDY